MELDDRRRKYFLILGQCKRLMRAEDDEQIIPGRQIVLKMAEGLAKQTANAIAPRGGSHLA